MGSGNTKHRQTESVTINPKSSALILQTEDISANKKPQQPTVSHANKRQVEPLQREDEPQMADKSSSFDHNRNDEIQESKTFAATEEKLAARGLTDRSLILHCDKTPQCAETYITVFKALNSMQAILAAGDHISKTDLLRQKAKVVSDHYHRQISTEHKIALGNCLAVIGFPEVTKEICIKLLAKYPNIFSYDRDPWPKPESGSKTVERDLLLEKQQDLLTVLTIACINYTDFCDAMNLAFNDVGLVPILVKAFDKLKDCTVQHVDLMDAAGKLKGKTVRGTLLSRVMGTLHNLAKRVPTRPNFHASNAVSIVLPIIDDKVNLYATKALLLLAYLIDEGNNHLIMANAGPIKYVISLIEKATRMSDHRYLGFSNSELAEGLAQIAINDSNKKQIVANGAIPVLTRMIKAAQNDEEKIAAAEALWVLAFDEENKEKIRENEQCMELLRKLKENVNEQVKKAASGALWEIEGKKHHSSGSNADIQSDSATKNHVMISYPWDVQSTMIRVKDRLQAAGFRVWMDLEQMGGSTLEAMANAVEDSVVVLVCVSQKYKESSNCRSEAEYAFQLKKDIVPLMMESNYRPDGWLGMIMGSKLWIDFSQGLKKLDSSCKDLHKELGVRGKGDVEVIQVPVTSADVVDAAPKVDISGWTYQDVVNWMKGFGLVLKMPKKCSNSEMSGPFLTRLYSLMIKSPEFYYSSVKDDLGLANVFKVVLFSDELEKLVG